MIDLTPESPRDPLAVFRGTSRLGDRALTTAEPPESILGGSVYPGLLRLGQKALLVGAAGVSKTYFLLQLLRSLCLGTDLFGIPVRRTPAGIILLESTRWEINQRLQLIRDHHGDSEDWAANVQYLCREDVRNLNLTDPASCQALAQWLTRGQVEICLLDPFAKLNPKPDRVSEDNAPLLRGLDSVIDETGAAFLITHHERKPSFGRAREGVLTRARGDTTIGADMDCVWGLSALGDEVRRLDLGTDGGKTRAAASPPPTFVRKTTTGVLEKTSPPATKRRDQKAWRRQLICEFVASTPGQWKSIADVFTALQDSCEPSESTVKNDLKYLEAEGVLIKRPGAGRKPALYRLAGNSDGDALLATEESPWDIGS